MAMKKQMKAVSRNEKQAKRAAGVGGKRGAAVVRKAVAASTAKKAATSAMKKAAASAAKKGVAGKKGAASAAKKAAVASAVKKAGVVGKKGAAASVSKKGAAGKSWKKLTGKEMKKAKARADIYPPVVNVLPPPLPGDPAHPRPTSLKPPKKPFTAKELGFFRIQLEEHRAMVAKNLNSLAGDNLRGGAAEASVELGSYSTHMADHGTDNFDRELALNLASGQQDSIYDIDDAIRRIDEGTFGICEQCGNPINPHRLRALPFARKCLACQSAEERGRTIYRPFGRTISQQGTDASESATDS